MKLASVVAPRPHHRVVESPLGDRLALFHLDTGRLHLLDGQTAAIWSQLRVADTIGELIVGLGDECGVSSGAIRSDVERTIAAMRADGLVLVDDRTVPPGPVRPSHAASLGSVAAPTGGSFAALDARIGIVCDDDEIVTAVTAVLAPLTCSDDPTVAIAITECDGSWMIAAGGEDPVRLGSRLSAVRRAIGEVNNLAVASVPDDLVFHAGAVEDRGRGVLLPGASNHGKSTLVTALVADGFAYLADEAAAVTEELVIRPFPKAIALAAGSFPLFADLAPPDTLDGLARAVSCREWHVAPERVGRVAGPTRVAAVVCPHWRAGANTHLAPVDPAEALHLLLADAYDFSLGGQSVFERLVHLVEHVPVVRLGYSDTAEAVVAVREVLEDNVPGEQS